VTRLELREALRSVEEGDANSTTGPVNTPCAETVTVVVCEVPAAREMRVWLSDREKSPAGREDETRTDTMVQEVCDPLVPVTFTAYPPGETLEDTETVMVDD
jgi:hypothetical protein